MVYLNVIYPTVILIPAPPLPIATNSYASSKLSHSMERGVRIWLCCNMANEVSLLRMFRHHMLEKGSQYLSSLFTTKSERTRVNYFIYIYLRCLNHEILLNSNYFLKTKRLQRDCIIHHVSFCLKYFTIVRGFAIRIIYITIYIIVLLKLLFSCYF